jgi:hypothetical protein
MQEEEQLTELQSVRTLKMEFNEAPLDVFWISIRKEHLVISAKAVKILLQFSTSYLREQVFNVSQLLKAKIEIIRVLSRKTAGVFVKK